MTRLPADFLCVGAAHWDIIGTTRARLPVGADVPGRVIRRPGGVAQNVARALAALGASVRLVAAVGTDPEGATLAADLARVGVETEWLHRAAGPTDAYLAIEGADGTLHAAIADCAGLERVGLSLLAPLTVEWSGTVVADGNLPGSVLAALLARAPALAFVAASPGKLGPCAPLLLGSQARLYLNREEAAVLCGVPLETSAQAVAALLQRGAAAAVVTDGAAPATAGDAMGLVTLPPPPVVPRSVTGAGDAFVARHLAALAEGLDPAPALAAALDAAARHITVAPS